MQTLRSKKMFSYIYILLTSHHCINVSSNKMMEPRKSTFWRTQTSIITSLCMQLSGRRLKTICPRPYKVTSYSYQKNLLCFIQHHNRNYLFSHKGLGINGWPIGYHQSSFRSIAEKHDIKLKILIVSPHNLDVIVLTNI